MARKYLCKKNCRLPVYVECGPVEIYDSYKKLPCVSRLFEQYPLIVVNSRSLQIAITSTISVSDRLPMRGVWPQRTITQK